MRPLDRSGAGRDRAASPECTSPDGPLTPIPTSGVVLRHASRSGSDSRFAAGCSPGWSGLPARLCRRRRSRAHRLRHRMGRHHEHCQHVRRWNGLRSRRQGGRHLHVPVAGVLRRRRHVRRVDDDERQGGTKQGRRRRRAAERHGDAHAGTVHDAGLRDPREAEQRHDAHQAGRREAQGHGGRRREEGYRTS